MRGQLVDGGPVVAGEAHQARVEGVEGVGGLHQPGQQVGARALLGLHRLLVVHAGGWLLGVTDHSLEAAGLLWPGPPTAHSALWVPAPGCGRSRLGGATRHQPRAPGRAPRVLCVLAVVGAAEVRVRGEARPGLGWCGGCVVLPA